MKHILVNEFGDGALAPDIRALGHDPSTSCWCEPDVDFESNPMEAEVLHRLAFQELQHQAEQVKEYASLEILRALPWVIEHLSPNGIYTIRSGGYRTQCNQSGLEWLTGRTPLPGTMPPSINRK